MDGFMDNELTLNLKQCHPEVNMASTTKPAVGDSNGQRKFVAGLYGAMGLNPDFNPDSIENFEKNLGNPAPEGR